MAMTTKDRDSIEYRRCADPPRYYAALREKGPVDYDEGLEGRIQVLTQEGEEQVFWHPEIFSSGMGANQQGNARPMIPLQIDPPDHVRYRRLLDPVFAPRNVNPLAPDVAALTNELIDRFEAKGECDFTTEFSIPLPSAIFLRLLGLPFEGLEDFLALKDGIVHPVGDTLEERRASSQATAKEIYALFGRVIAERKEEPRDDVITTLVNAEVDGERLTDEQLLDITFLLLLAGLDTVSISLQCMLYYLSTHSERRREVAGDLDVVPAAVEELMRWNTPVQGVTRVALHETEVAGCPIHEGDRVQVMLGSINTDPNTAAGYDRIDFHRENNRHLAFGGGVHRCLGSHLARLELRTALREWHRRIPEYELAPGTDIEWNGDTLRGINHLPLVWSPR
jgi:cytochrome P450